MNVRLPALLGLSLLIACSGEPEPTPKPPPVLTPAPTPEPEVADPCKDDVYYSKGVHNPCGCDDGSCEETRAAGDPADPQYPPQWTSDWTMYRVFQNYEDNLPPWGSPPAGFMEEDYEVSQGWTAYDSTYVAENDGGTGAMMEHYEKRCLPIFPIDNQFTCSFVSLGDTAYFLTYEEDRPADMPACCLFSPYNHPPRTDFIKHLPYSAEDSSHLDDSLQAYRYIAEPHDVWFAYAFYRDQYVDPETKQHLLPQSFYFSGYPGTPPDAPFVSQFYTDFSATAPDPAETWAQVAQMCPAEGPLPACQLFEPPSTDEPAAEAATDAAPTASRSAESKSWSSIQPAKETDK